MKYWLAGFALLIFLSAGCIFLQEQDGNSLSSKSLYKCFNGKMVQNLSECIQETLACPKSCDDGNACTQDFCGKETNFKCAYSPQACCGDGACSLEESESCFSCESDCSCAPGYLCSPSNILSDSRGCISPSRIQEGGQEPRAYSWNYSEREWLLEIGMDPATEAFYSSRERGRPYDLYASDQFDDNFIATLVKYFEQAAAKHNLGKDETAYLVASFVQSLPYTADDVTKLADEYPRFPYETLYDGGGDCEDTSILAAAILRKLGYDAVLLQYQAHMAVGVRCSLPGRDKITNNGVQYCYLETTGQGWDIGKIPDEYKGETPKVLAIYPRPYVYFNSSALYTYDGRETSAVVNVTLKNLGSEGTRNARVNAILEEEGGGALAQSTYYLPKSLAPEEELLARISSLSFQGSKKFRLRLEVRADNMELEELTGDWVEWEGR